LNKMIKLNKQMSVFWIWFILATVLFGISISIYGINAIYINLDRGINTHNPLNNNIVSTLYKSIEDALFSLGVVNYVSLVVIIILIIILLIKFHFNRKISTVYIWLLVVLLIIAIAYSAYIGSDLYSNIDSYVNIYNNNIKKEFIFVGTMSTNRHNISKIFYKNF
jgi:hypothetical protein